MAENYSIPKELAHGVNLLVNGAVIKASYMTKNLADKMLSKSALKRGIDEGDNIMFPAEDGRSSIPMYELSQKGYLELNRQEIKRHFSRLLNFVPDYLRERGILPDKKPKSIEDRLQLDFNRYAKELRFESKEEIIAKSRDTAIRQDILKHFSDIDLATPGIGLLLTRDNVLEKIYESLDHKNYFEEQNSLKASVSSVTQALKENSNAVSKALEPFVQELSSCKKALPEFVEFKIASPTVSKRMRMEMSEFYKHLDLSVLERYAQHAMPEFPHREYFGKDGAEIFDKLVEKRFCENLVKNFKDYMSYKDNGYMMTVDCTNKQLIKTDELTELRNRAFLKEFVDNNYSKPDKALSEISRFFAEKQELLSEIQKSIQPEQAQKKGGYVDIQVEEFPNGNVYVFLNKQGEKAIFDERFDDEMRKNYNMPTSIEDCLMTLGVSAVAVENIRLNIAPEKKSLNELNNEGFITSKAEDILQKYGITVQIDEFPKGNVFVFKTDDGKQLSFDERFDDEIRDYYGMPKSVDECLKSIGLTGDEISQWKAQSNQNGQIEVKALNESFSAPASDEPKEVKPESKNKAEKPQEANKDLPFPEVGVKQITGKIREEPKPPKLKPTAKSSQADLIKNNIAAQVAEMSKQMGR